MHSITLIFPNQLFRSHPGLHKNRPVHLVEEWLFFSQYHFHKKKLILHRASMKFYQEHLNRMGFQTVYHERTDIRNLVPVLASQGVKEIILANPVDDWLQRRMDKACRENNINTIMLPSPAFMNTMEEVNDFFNSRRSYFQTDFYIWQRKKRKILVDGSGQPMGGKWSFDAENRERFPRQAAAPSLHWTAGNTYTKEANCYVEKHFASNPGSPDLFGYPVTFEDAEKWLVDFLEQRFRHFGRYEDAMARKENFLYHSLLSPLLNTGLLLPEDVLEQALEFAGTHDLPLNSVEGFTRQIMGWREFIRIVYEREGRIQRTRNFFSFSRKIPRSFWTAETGIQPVDEVIRHSLQDGYTHHINRLMVIGNFMLLCEFDPTEVYQWFMEIFIDAYDWVMVPNVYGMTQYADGGLMTTKPYISGSNYLMKMGDWEKGPWQITWDALFWRFMHVHRDLFVKNPRMGMLLKTFDKMDPKKKAGIMETAGKFLQRLDDQV